MTGHVGFEIADGVGLITLNRPDRLNALDDAMHRELDAAFVRAFQEDTARVIVLTGAGRAFCAGADMERLDQLVASGGRDYDIPRPGIVSDAFSRLDAPPELLVTYTMPLAIPKPVIAAVNGACIGVGMVLAASCDIRFVGRRAMFAAAFAQLGVVAEFGLAWLLPRLIGHGAAADLLMSGRRLQAEEAVRIGLASRIEEDDALLEAAMSYARSIATSAAPRSIRIIKQQLWDGYRQSFGEASASAHDLLLESLAGPDFAEGIAAHREKRSPRFGAR